MTNQEEQISLSLSFSSDANSFQEHRQLSEFKKKITLRLLQKCHGMLSRNWTSVPSSLDFRHSFLKSLMKPGYITEESLQV